MRALALCVSLLFLPAIASATQVLALDLPEIAAEAELMVLGRVVSSAAEPIAEATGQYHTRVTVAVTQWIEGAGSDAPRTLELSTPGGQVGRFAQRIAGTPSFRPGEEVVVAVARSEDGRLRIVGFNQGLWRVIRTPLGVTVSSDRRGVELVQRDPVGRPRLTDIPSVDARSLVSLIATLKAHAGGGNP